MDKIIEFLAEQFRCIRNGDISANLLDTVKVDAYSQKLPLNQLAYTSPEKGRILITPYDSNLLSSIDKSLKLEGFNSYIFSKTQVVVSLPPKSGEDTLKVISQVKKLAEDSRIYIRNVRKVTRQKIEISDKEIDKVTSEYISRIDKMVSEKIREVS